MLIHTIYLIAAILSILLYISSIQFKTKQKILLIQILSSTCYIICYLIIKAYNGLYVELFEQLKNIIILFFEKKNKETPKSIIIVLFIILLLINIYDFNNNYILLIPLLINIIYLLSYIKKNPQIIRLSIFICGFLWIIYNYIVGAYILIIGNILEIISAIIAFIRFKKAS